ncbi:MAG TPA: sigma-54 dependent transcriptional regulator [Myxococcaceae bacterium]|jgi:two-component system nitrogen regulation response regulator GlnG
MKREPLADASTAGPPRLESGSPEASLGPVLTVVSHPVASRVGERAPLRALAAGQEVRLSRRAPDFGPPGSALGTVLLDPFLSRTPIVFSRRPDGGVRLVVPEGSTPVVADEPVRGALEVDPAALARGVPLELANRVVLLLHLAPFDLPPQRDALGMVGASAAMQRVREQILQIADLDVMALVRGETGTGKELVAQAIHHHSRRRDGPFVSVNLGTIPRDLATTELFGARKGAFTGALADRDGFFAAAQRGTLFLDEVGEAAAEVQVMLLRVLETGEMYPVGARTPVSTDVRLIAATDADLEKRIADGSFKAPLLHRLAGYEIRLPPLRERREDIGLLFHHFARRELEAIGEASKLSPADPHAEPWLPASLAAVLLRHPWPGNIRQLRNLARQLVIGSRGHPRLQVDPRLHEELSAAAGGPRPAAPAPEPREKPAARRKPSGIDAEELRAALRESEWDLQAAADRLGISRPSMYTLLQKNPAIRTTGDLSPEEIAQCFRDCGGDLASMARRLEVSKRALGQRVKGLGLLTRRKST